MLIGYMTSPTALAAWAKLKAAIAEDRLQTHIVVRLEKPRFMAYKAVGIKRIVAR